LDSETLKAILLIAPVLLFSLTAHEFAHAWAALSQGDPTARDAGRLTLNPLKHIDLWWTILLPGIMLLQSHGQTALGGAKPCPVNPANYREYRRGDIIVSLAGVTMNLAIAIASALLVFTIGVIGRDLAPDSEALGFIQKMFAVAAPLNILLLFFNLLPIPPLDGSHVIKHFLPPTLAAAYEKASRFGVIVLIALLYFGGNILQFVFIPGDALAHALRPYLLGTF
jgi:Zn-dependent protease